MIENETMHIIIEWTSQPASFFSIYLLGKLVVACMQAVVHGYTVAFGGMMYGAGSDRRGARLSEVVASLWHFFSN